MLHDMRAMKKLEANFESSFSVDPLQFGDEGFRYPNRGPYKSWYIFYLFARIPQLILAKMTMKINFELIKVCFYIRLCNMYHFISNLKNDYYIEWNLFWFWLKLFLYQHNIHTTNIMLNIKLNGVFQSETSLDIKA